MILLNTTKYEVKFEQRDLTTKVYTEKLDISNDTTLVEFSKTDVTGDKELTGIITVLAISPLFASLCGVDILISTFILFNNLSIL